MNQQTLNGQWTEIKGKISEKWGELTDNDLQQARGSTEQLIGMIEKKTGESRDAINAFLDSLANDEHILNKASEAVRDYANAAGESVQDVANEAMEQAKVGYEQTEQLVKQRPMESLAVCFGVGVITGIVGGLLVRSR
ncbi:UNVERIFIED_CONTAM: hypothetical protein GTU68_060232 [Idotea baltica]|nr:hypothetical protein [Idotea baltica]